MEVHRRAECIVLVEVEAERSVVIDVDGRRVDFIAAHQYRLLAEGEGPLGACLPLQPEEVGGAEGVVVVDLAVEALAHAEGQPVGQLPEYMQVEVFTLEVGVIHPVLRLLVEGGAGVE